MTRSPTAVVPQTGPPLQLCEVYKRYNTRARTGRRGRTAVNAVDGVSLTVSPGETLGLVGESGSGKSTIARLATRLLEPTSGAILYDGLDFTNVRGQELRAARRKIQMVFQDPYSSFDPYVTVASSIEEPLRTHAAELGRTTRRDIVNQMLEQVGLSPLYGERHPSQLSGGQLQRAAIARALITEPQLLVLDEPVSALDVSTQAQVINLLQDLKETLGVAYLFIAHDLAVVRHVSDRIAVMYRGRIVEQGPAATVYETPRHPYTASLVAAIPSTTPDEHRQRSRIVLPDISDDKPELLSQGCRFRDRCAYVHQICHDVDPPAFRPSADVTVACHLFAGDQRTTISDPTLEPVR